MAGRQDLFLCVHRFGGEEEAPSSLPLRNKPLKSCAQKEWPHDSRYSLELVCRSARIHILQVDIYDGHRVWEGTGSVHICVVVGLLMDGADRDRTVQYN